MSINDWSLVYFAAMSLYMFINLLSTIGFMKLWKFISVALAWMMLQGVTLIYALNTNQIGFIFIIGLNIIIVILGIAFNKQAIEKAE